MVSRFLRVRSFCLIVLLLAFMPIPIAAQSAAFSYQGKLSDNGNPANGLYDFNFSLWDAASGGAGIGEINLILGVTVTNGSFMVTLNFGTAAFPGANRYLEIAVRPAGGSTYTTLSPRQQILATPYSIKATVADGLSVTCVNCITSSQIASVNGSAVTGTIPVASVPAGSGNYVQNTTTQQPASNFNVSGDGTVGGSLNVSAGVNAFSESNIAVHATSPSGTAGLFEGRLHVFRDGNPTTDLQTSQFRIIGQTNSARQFLFGYDTTANVGVIQAADTLVGKPLSLNPIGGFLGVGTVNPNSHFHLKANAPQGFAIQMENTSTAKRLYIGNYGTTGGGDHWPGLDSANSSFLYSENNLVFTTPGGIHFSGSTTAEHMGILSNGNVGIGIVNPSYKFEVNSTNANAFAAHIRTSGLSQGTSYGLVVSAGTDALDSALQIRDQAGNPLMRVRGNGYVGIGTTNPAVMLDVAGAARFAEGIISGPLGGGAPPLTVNGSVQITGQLAVSTMVTIGTQPVCLNGDLLTRCSSSSLRYKTNVGSYRPGLELVTRLRPITFDWKTDRTQDFGLAAEEVEKVASELVFYRDGQIEGVRYDRIGVVLINAVKEQQAQIEKQQAQIESLRSANAALKQQNAALQQHNAEIDTRLNAIARQLRHLDPRASLRRSAKASGAAARK